MIFSQSNEFKNYIYSFKGSFTKVSLICPQCNKNFTYPKNQILCKISKGYKVKFCSRECQGHSKLRQIKTNCGYCNKELSVAQNIITSSKSGKVFCNNSCAAKHMNTNKTTGFRRSYAEKYLILLLKDKFPGLNIQENVRNILSNGLEIDIFIPSINLAIELNGPLHYFPIYGQEKFEQIQNRDLKKQIEIQQLKYNLVLINTSNISGEKKTEKFINQYFSSHLEEIINRLM